MFPLAKLAGELPPRPAAASPRTAARKNDLRVMQKRLALLRVISRTWKSGLTFAEACERMLVAPVTVWRWRNALAAGGPRALLPRRSPGRPQSALQRSLTPRVLTTVEKLALQTGSVSAAWLAFARRSDCPRPLATVIRYSRPVPSALIRAIRLRRLPAIVVAGAKDFSIQVRA